MKTCSRCKVEQSKSEFRREPRAKDNLYSHCKSCDRIAQRKRRSDPVYKEKELRTARARKYNGPHWLLGLAKKRASSRNMDFDIDESDIVIPTHCPLLLIPISPNDGKAEDNSPSLDRKDQTKGYVKGNVWVISRKANAMKAHATLEELDTFTKNVQKLILNNVT